MVVATLLSASHRAEAGAAAEVRDDRAARGPRVAVPLGQRDGHVLVGQAVEAVAAHAAFPQRVRQRQHLLHLRQRAVEGRVEAGDLRQMRAPRPAAPRSPAAHRAGAAARAGCSRAGPPAPRGRRAPARCTCCRRARRGAPRRPAGGRPCAARRRRARAAARRGRAARHRAPESRTRRPRRSGARCVPPMPSTRPDQSGASRQRRDRCRRART